MTVEMRHSPPQKALSMRWMMLPAIGFVLALIVFPFLYAGWLALNDFVFGSSMRFTGGGNFARLVKAGVAPPRSSVFEGPEFKAWAGELPIRSRWAAALVELGRTGVSVYQSPTERIPEAREIIGRAVQEVVLGQKSAKDAACDADRDLEKLM